MYNSKGTVVATSSGLALGAGKDLRVSLNTLGQNKKVAGAVMVSFTENTGVALQGQISIYKKTGTEIDFAFSRDLHMPVHSTVYALANTLNPANTSTAVENKVELINADSHARRFRVRIYNSKGSMVKDYGWQTVNAHAEKDFSGGPGTSVGKYLVKVEPEYASGDFYVSLTRYLKNAAGTAYVAGVSQDFALGAGTRRYLPLSDNSAGCRKVFLELGNPLSSEVRTVVKVKNSSGRVLNGTSGQTIKLGARRLNYLDLSTLATSSVRGVVEVKPNKTGGLITQLVTYETSCSSGDLLTAYQAKPVEAGTKVQRGFFTRYLSGDNFLEISNAKSGNISVRIETYSKTGKKLKIHSYTIGGYDTKVYNLSSRTTWGVSPASDGHVKITSTANGQYLARILRAKTLTTAPDFAYPTVIR